MVSEGIKSHRQIVNLAALPLFSTNSFSIMVITIERLPEWIRIQSDDGSSDHSPWLRLSPIDSLMPSYHVPLLLAFSSKLRTSSRLKDSLEKVLGYYMELAGRIGRDESGDLAIRLNNEGVFWVEAVATETLVEFLGSDDGHGNIHKLTPMSSSNNLDSSKISISEVYSFQITSFSCGGFALGLGIQHHAADCNAVPGFLADWAALASGKAAKFSDSRSSDRTLMMPRDPPMPEFEHPEYALTPKHYTVLTPEESKALTTRRIHFRKGELDRLKNSESAGGSSSTFVCLAVHLWRLITMARGVSGGRRTVLYCPVNGRRGLSLPVDYFGNAVFRARCEVSAEDLTEIQNPCRRRAIEPSL
ncbi:hydroxycinnamoyltransferase 2-like [Selaginella moellendorffii]|uniref:hydroxycinnamoyltransferase 2-like n=1 Tax=Selaginella moellendorffii TaxID=88036 RepID=UPI000D1C6A32|nr:hydroxycinnamoyltransferase 2-like [Selaginella moellendorffii]|eukprot:XP_024523505.1 hydroxycinnamoyltransferase 2-like [Selaginella moellendorffii]